MKNRKFAKPLLIVLAMILVCVMSVFATLAYLTSTTDEVENTFTVGDVVITLDEADVDVNGVVETDGEGNALPRVQANEYKLVPAHEYTKDPTVHVDAASEDCFVRAIVTVTDIADLKAAGITAANFVTKFSITAGDMAVYSAEENAEGTAFVIEYRCATKQTAGANIVVFSDFTTPNLDNVTLKSIKEMNINVIGQAIQADTFDDADEAFAALDAAANA